MRMCTLRQQRPFFPFRISYQQTIFCTTLFTVCARWALKRYFICFLHFCSSWLTTLGVPAMNFVFTKVLDYTFSVVQSRPPPPPPPAPLWEDARPHQCGWTQISWHDQLPWPPPFQLLHKPPPIVRTAGEKQGVHGHGGLHGRKLCPLSKKC